NPVVMSASGGQTAAQRLPSPQMQNSDPPVNPNDPVIPLQTESQISSAITLRPLEPTPAPLAPNSGSVSPETGSTALPRPEAAISSEISPRPIEQMPAPVIHTTAPPAADENTAPQIGASPEMRALETEIKRRENKDFSIKKDEAGNVTHRGKDRDNDHNWWDVFKNAGLGAMDGLAATGTLSGAAAGAIGGGVQGGIDRNADEKRFNNYALANQRQKYASVFQREKQNADWIFNEKARRAKLEGDALDNRGKVINQLGDVQEQVIKQFEPLRKSIEADGIVTSDEASDFKQKTGMEIKDYDARKFTKEEVGGVTFATPELGAPQYKPVETLPINPEKVVKEITTPSGNKYQLTQSKAADLEIAIAQGDANRAMQVLLKNTEIENDNVQNDNKTKTERELALAERDGAMTLYNLSVTQLSTIDNELSAMRNQLQNLPATIDRNETVTDAEGNTKMTKKQVENPLAGRIQAAIKEKEQQKLNAGKTLNEALSKASAAEAKYNRLPDPAKLKKVPAPPRLSRLPQVSEAEFVQRAKGKGLAGEQLKSAVQKAKEDGVIK
ncbi:MAG TPA: hypothetical protein VF692_11130, partial [Pyrinomonadaceae bacterium]